VEEAKRTRKKPVLREASERGAERRTEQKKKTSHLSKNGDKKRYFVGWRGTPEIRKALPGGERREGQIKG